jgi:hypothetical protein
LGGYDEKRRRKEIGQTDSSFYNYSPYSSAGAGLPEPGIYPRAAGHFLLKKRRGFLLWEALVVLLFVSTAALAILPAAGQMAETAVSLRGRTRTVDEMGAVYHLLTEKIRASRETPGDGKSGGDRLTYYDDSEHGVKPFTFFTGNNKLYVRLYNGLVQPITGIDMDSKEAAAFHGGQPLFCVERKGLVRMRGRWEGGRLPPVEMKTAVLSEADYFRKGDIYE